MSNDDKALIVEKFIFDFSNLILEWQNEVDKNFDYIEALQVKEAVLLSLKSFVDDVEKQFLKSGNIKFGKN